MGIIASEGTLKAREDQHHDPAIEGNRMLDDVSEPHRAEVEAGDALLDRVAKSAIFDHTYDTYIPTCFLLAIIFVVFSEC